MTLTNSPTPAGSSRPEDSPERPDSHWLNLPNLITICRLGLAVVLFTLIGIDGWWKTAAAIFLVAAATDFLDGYIARRYGLVTPLGRILDPFADKIIICGAFVFLMAVNNTPGIDGVDRDSGVTAWIVVAVLAREMFVTSLRAYLEQHGRDFSAVISGKAKMIVQCTAVPLCLVSLDPTVIQAAPRFSDLRDVAIWTTVVITVYSGIEYAVRAQRMLSGRKQGDRVDE